jgi:hypothetical protein
MLFNYPQEELAYERLDSGRAGRIYREKVFRPGSYAISAMVIGREYEAMRPQATEMAVV